jgi:peptidoglycan-associated lipoprotein
VTLRRDCAAFGAAALLGIALGCTTTDPPPPATPSAGPSLPAPPPRQARYLSVGLGADLDRCETETPHFFYDVDVPRPQDRLELRELATCLQSEPYRDLNLMLIGRADHRGDTEYNDELAQRRARHVAEILVSHGVDRGRLMVVSRGEGEAIGHTDPLASMGYDRRVDIVVMNPVSPGHAAKPVIPLDEP